MSIKLNSQSDNNSVHVPHHAVRRVNHINHHKTHSSVTLNRMAVTRPAVSPKRNLRAQSVTHAPTLHLSRMERTVRPERLHRANRVETSPFISHFAKPDTRSFVSVNPPMKQIQSVVHKPEVNKAQNTEDLFYKAMEKLHNDIKEMEQLPIKRLHSFTKRLVSNRFNQVSLEESN